jgi:hypothetical protein
MTEKQLSKDESLQLITEMIGQAKRNFAKGGSFFFLLWGWVVLLANIGNYVMMKWQLFDKPYLIWMITIPAAILSIIYSVRMDNKAVVKSHLDRMYGLVWLSIFVCAVIILTFISDSFETINPIILVFAGLGTFLSGCMLRFTPLVLGGFALWVAAIAASMLPVTEQYLLASIGILAGYLIPGYLLRKAENG